MHTHTHAHAHTRIRAHAHTHTEAHSSPSYFSLLRRSYFTAAPKIKLSAGVGWANERVRRRQRESDREIKDKENDRGI